MRVEPETTKEVREMVKIREKVAKLRAARRYNTKVQSQAFQLGTSYGEIEVKPEKISERESLASTEKVPSGSQPTLITKRTDYKSWMAKQSHEHGMPPT